jgi:hypothetical protein
LARIAEDDVADARQLVRDALAPWSQGGFHVQHLYALRLEAYGDLYEGRPHMAYARVVDAWGAIRASQLLRVQFGRIDMRLLRARVAVASAAARRSGRAPLLAQAEEDAAALEREVRRDARPAATLIRACIAAVKGDHTAARQLLASAAYGYDSAGMVLLAACARRRLGEVAGGSEGEWTMAEMDVALRRQGVARPDRWIRMYAPGFGQ